jgi:division protein CdvB (Snf7/Vps24/ESCRT-III family)
MTSGTAVMPRNVQEISRITKQMKTQLVQMEEINSGILKTMPEFSKEVAIVNAEISRIAISLNQIRRTLNLD